MAIALLLPAVEPWHQPTTADTASVSVATGAAQVVVARPSGFHLPTWKREYLLPFIATGAALRFLWIGAGLVRLRRHRLDARDADHSSGAASPVPECAGLSRPPSEGR